MDWQHTQMLLDIIHKAAAAGPRYTWLVVLADAELDKLKATIEGSKSQPELPLSDTIDGGSDDS